jgi:acyl carrier protein
MQVQNTDRTPVIDDREGASTTIEGRGVEAIQAWIVGSLEEALELEPGELDVNEPFDTYGLDSTEAVNLIRELEDWLECELPPYLVYSHPAVAALARLLGEPT